MNGRKYIKITYLVETMTNEKMKKIFLFSSTQEVIISEKTSPFTTTTAKCRIQYRPIKVSTITEFWDQISLSAESLNFPEISDLGAQNSKVK